MKKQLVFTFLFFVTLLSAQNNGVDPKIALNADNGYDPVGIRKPVAVGDNIGKLQFAGWLSKVDKWHVGVEIKSVVSGQPAASFLPADLVVSTGAVTLQERLRIAENGNVGINTSSPTARLSVLDYGGSNKAIFEAIGGGAGNAQKKFQISTSPNGTLNTFLQGSMELDSGNMVIKNGKLGIGLELDDLPGDYRLYVNGSVLCTEVRVNAKSKWPDFVFLKDYPLLPVDSLQKHIKNTGHLPGVPSAEDVKLNGIEIGEMQQILLQKVEELTLYIIQQKEEIDQLKRDIDQLRNPKKQ